MNEVTEVTREKGVVPGLRPRQSLTHTRMWLCARVCVQTYVCENKRESYFKDRCGAVDKHLAHLVPLQKIFPDEITAPRATI